MIPSSPSFAVLLRALVLAAGTASGLGGCGTSPDPAAPVAAPVELEVQGVTARTEKVSVPIRASGTVVALQTSNITALVEGPVERVFVQVGDRVTRGQPLLRIRQADSQRRVGEAEAALRLADAEVLQAERAYARLRELRERGIVAAAQFDDAEVARDVAWARRDQARASVATARQALADTVLRSPYDGVVTQRMVDEGMFLSSRPSGGGQSAALQLQELRVVAAIVAVPESRVSELRRGQSARLFITGQPRPLSSKVHIINDLVDPRTRTVEVRLPVKNPDYAINSGVSVVAEIETDPTPAIVVPRRALRGDSASPHLFVVAAGVAQRRAVKTADLDIDRVRVLEGLAEGEAFVLDPPTVLADGVRVRVRDLPDASPSAAPSAANRR